MNIINCFNCLYEYNERHMNPCLNCHNHNKWVSEDEDKNNETED